MEKNLNMIEKFKEIDNSIYDLEKEVKENRIIINEIIDHLNKLTEKHGV